MHGRIESIQPDTAETAAQQGFPALRTIINQIDRFWHALSKSDPPEPFFISRHMERRVPSFTSETA